MRATLQISVIALVAAATACAGGGATRPSGAGGGGSSSGRAGSGGVMAEESVTAGDGASATGYSATAASGASASTGGGAPLTCAMVNDGVGCCDSAGVLRYCTQTMKVQAQPCFGKQVCGWNTAKKYYDCVSPPGGPDPAGLEPITCGGGGAGASGGATSSASTGGGPVVTWTQLYNQVFGPKGTSTCVKNGGCHTGSQSGFKCGSTRSACYEGLVSDGLVTTGSDALSSLLVDSVQSPLCGPLGGSMPKNGVCIDAAVLADIKAWLSGGAQNN